MSFRVCTNMTKVKSLMVVEFEKPSTSVINAVVRHGSTSYNASSGKRFGVNRHEVLTETK